MDIYCIHYITFRGKRENKMKKFRLFPLILLLCMAFTLLAPCAFAVDDPDIGAQRAVIADLDSGRILYSKNMDEKASPASLTKIMTVLLAVEALENGSHTADELVTAQADCPRGHGRDQQHRQHPARRADAVYRPAVLCDARKRE